MSLYTKDPKDSITKFTDLINMFSKVAGYKINTQKKVAWNRDMAQWVECMLS
jgi:hypothetical protein